jgi:hypothetical protein
MGLLLKDAYLFRALAHTMFRLPKMPQTEIATKTVVIGKIE